MRVYREIDINMDGSLNREELSNGMQKISQTTVMSESEINELFD